MNCTVLRCGGSGSHLGTLSRDGFAVQLGSKSPFRTYTLRESAPDLASPIILTVAGFWFIVADQLANIGIGPYTLFVAPKGRNSESAIHSAALCKFRWDRGCASTDHVIAVVAAFRLALRQTGYGCLSSLALQDRLSLKFGVVTQLQMNCVVGKGIDRSQF